MKTHIQFKKVDGSDGIALIEGSTTDALQAKKDLAAKLRLPHVDGRHGEHEDIDSRLRLGNIDPASITFSQVAE